MRTIFSIVAILLMFGVVGAMDYEDEQAAAVAYCENVRDKVWPDYKDTYKKECKNIFAERLTSSK